MKNINNKRSGFTLIELLISLSIIALMSGLAFAALNSSRQTANDTRRVGDLKNVQGYLEIYFSRCDRYPCNADCSSASSLTWTQLETALAGIVDPSRFPEDPVPGAIYSYWTDGSNYVLGTKLQTDSKSILKESYTGSEFGSTCDKTARQYCIHS